MPLAGEEPQRYGTAPRQAGLKPASTVILSLDVSPAGLPMDGDESRRDILRCGRGRPAFSGGQAPALHFSLRSRFAVRGGV